MRPRTIKEVARRTREDAAWRHHLREFLDTFYAADGECERQSALLSEDPGFLGDTRTDAFLGGAAEHLARRWQLSIPSWVRDPRRYLDIPMFVPDEKPLRGYLVGASPVAFRTRLIFTGPDPLQRARFPYHRGCMEFPMDYPARHQPTSG
ncbi:MAG TPA: hypothetical protein ENH55_04800 [Aurantimonas coralicida]|uniref:Uncharacterized protein n=2 Tax=root TaxID=1 RepID=A0A9C9TJ02_9HYPH|nr:hypothetical protein [Aurantimonas coralicida]HEU02373.1 hypothetical protein [Aurantimonas coralicida]